MAQKLKSKIASPPPKLRSRSAPFIERAPLPIIEVQGIDHVITYVNPAFCDLLKKRRIDLIGKPFCEIVPKGEECTPILDRVYQTGEAATIAKEDHDEPAHWFFAMWPALDEKERPVGVIIQLTKDLKFRQNIKEVNEALLIAGLRQQEMTEQAERLNAQLFSEIAARRKTALELAVKAGELAEKARLIDLSNDAIIVRDLSDKIRLWNKGAEKLFGWTAEEVTGKDLHNLLHTEFPKPKMEIIEHLNREGAYQGEVLQTARDGRRIRSICGWVLDQPTKSIFTSYTDITERAAAVEALRESEERYHNLFDSIDEGFCIIETIFDKNEKPVDYRFLEVNPSFETQCGLKDVVGKRMRELVPDHERNWFEIFAQIALTGEPIRFVNEAKALQRWFDVYGFRIGGTGSHKVAILFTDITKRKQDETELRESREKLTRHAEILETRVIERTSQLETSIKSLENLNYTIAHDLRAPIRAIKGLTAILLEDFPLDDTGKRYAQNINTAAGRMGQLVDDLLEYGKLSHLEFPLHTLDLEVEIENVLVENAEEIKGADAIILVRDPLPKVEGNKLLVHQILNNLILNAVKFVPPGNQPKIVIHAETRGPKIRLWLEDNGIGIPEQYQEKIFGVFERLHSTEEFRGTGVGLAIVKRAVERMGGEVGVESATGNGSKFWIELPRSKAGE